VTTPVITPVVDELCVLWMQMLAVLLGSTRHHASVVPRVVTIPVIARLAQMPVRRIVDPVNPNCASSDLDRADMTAAVRKRRYIVAQWFSG